MKRSFPALFFMILTVISLLQLPSLSFADAGKVAFFDQNGQAANFTSADIKTLGMKVNLQKPLKGYTFDYLQVVVSPSYNPKMEWRKGWMANELTASTLADIPLVPKSTLINGYGTPFMLADVKEYPSAKGYDSVTLQATVKLYKKIGERKETRWDKYKEKFITETIYQWDEGVQVAAGSATFAAPKMSAAEAKAVEEDKSEKLKQLNEIRKKMGKPPLTKLP